jgi:hypothetical protein
MARSLADFAAGHPRRAPGERLPRAARNPRERNEVPTPGAASPRQGRGPHNRARARSPAARRPGDPGARRAPSAHEAPPWRLVEMWRNPKSRLGGGGGLPIGTVVSSPRVRRAAREDQDHAGGPKKCWRNVGSSPIIPGCSAPTRQEDGPGARPTMFLQVPPHPPDAHPARTSLRGNGRRQAGVVTHWSERQ